MRKRSIGFLPKSHRDRREGRTSDDGLVNHRGLQKLGAELVSPDFLPYMFAWVTGGKPSPAALSLIPQRNGTVTATFGDLRLKVEPVLDADGAVRVFANESEACEWAWAWLQEARTPPPLRSEAEERAMQESGERVMARYRALERDRALTVHEILAAGEDLTVDRIGAYLAVRPMTTANWFGPTGRPELSTWIDRDGSVWRVWDTDEKGVEMDFMTLRTEAEAEALDAFLRRAESHRKAALQTVRSFPADSADEDGLVEEEKRAR